MQDRKLQSRKYIIKNCLSIIEALIEAQIYRIDRLNGDIRYLRHVKIKRSDFIALNKKGVNHQPGGFNGKQWMSPRQYLLYHVGSDFEEDSWLPFVRYYLIQELYDIRRLEKNNV